MSVEKASVIFKNIDILNDRFEVERNMFVGVKGGVIDYIGATCPEAKYDSEIYGSGKLLSPGFFNLHSHAAMTILEAMQRTCHFTVGCMIKFSPLRQGL